jgi:hypothetical protein
MLQQIKTGCLERTINLLKILQPSAECLEANHPLEEGNSVTSKYLMFSDVPRCILDIYIYYAIENILNKNIFLK